MKRNICRLLVLLLVLSVGFAGAHAQGACFTLKGVVYEEQGDCVPYATVRAVSAADSTVRHVAVAKKDGTFSMDSVAEGKYLLTVTCVGYEDFARNVSVSGSTGVCTIVLKEDKNMLDGVTVMAGFTKVKPSGDVVVQVHGNPLAKGKTTVGFLRFLRDLEVTSSSISVRGKENTLIYLDGHRVSFDQLKAIPPSMIERIEIEPNADASYGVNATGGVVKVFLRKTGGLIGSATLYGEADYYSPVRVSPGTNLFYSDGKLSVGNFFDSRLYERYRSEYTEKSVSDGVEDETRVKALNYGHSYYDNLSLRYAFDETNYIDVYGGISVSEGDRRNNSVSLGSSMRMNTVRDVKDYNGGLQVRKSLFGKSGSYLHFKAEYGKSREAEDESYVSGGTSDFVGRDYNQDQVSVEPYVFLCLSEKSFLSAGMYYYYMIDRNRHAGTEAFGMVPDMRFVYKGHDYSAWANYRLTVGKLYFSASLSYVGGKNVYKDYFVPGNSVDYTENGLYPSLVFQWNIDRNKWRSLNVSYFHYYSYPNYNYRSPAVVWQNEKLYSTGNTGLKVQTYDQIQVYYSFNRSWALNYIFNYGDDLVKVLMNQDAARPGVYYTRPENAGNRFVNTLKVTYSGRPLSFWYTRNNLGVSSLREKMPGHKVCNTKVSFSTDNDFSLCKVAGLTAAFSVSSKSETLSHESNATYSVDFGAYASLLKDKLTLNFLWGNVFYNHGTMKMHGDGWEVFRRDLYSRTRLQLTATWNFSLGRKIRKEDLPTSRGVARQNPTL